MPPTDLPHPVSPAVLIRFGFDESTAEAAAQEIAELVHAIFGPFDPVGEEVWAAARMRDLGPADLGTLLMEAAEATDPLAFVADFSEAEAMLGRRMWLLWSSRRARALGHPTSLRDQAWTALSEVAQGEVREALRHLSDYQRSQIRRGSQKDAGVDTLLLGLAQIFARYTGYSLHEMRLSSHQEGQFIGLAQLVLARLPPLPTARPRLHPKLGTASALSTRWRRLKKHARTGSDE